MTKKLKIFLCITCVAVLILGYVYRENRNRNFDYTAPELSVNDDKIKVSINATDEELLEGVSAYDKVDGDISDRIIIEKLEKDTEGDYNEFLVTYVCFDKSGNVDRAQRKLIYSDYVRPHFKLDSDLRFPINTPVSLFNYITAEDSLDGNISSFITIDGARDIGQVTTPGTFLFDLSVTNSVGDVATLPIQIELYEDSYEQQVFTPTIALTDYLVYIKKGKKFKPQDYLDYITDEGRCVIEREGDENDDTQVNEGDEELAQVTRIPISDIEIDSGVNTDKVGVYNVGYSYKSRKNGYTGSTKLIVVVE